MKVRRFAAFLPLACTALAFQFTSAGELVRNGDFTQVMAEWGIPPALRPWYPYQHPAGVVALHPDTFGYTGTVLEQTLNVTGVANQTVHVSIDLGADFGLPAGHSYAVVLEYLDTSNARHQVTVVAPDNAAIPAGSMTTFSAPYTFPADASKLVAVLIQKNHYGDARGDNVSITHSTLTGGPVPTITQVSAASVLYGQTATLTGHNFGASQGTVTVGGATNGVSISSWSNESVVIAINDPCPGGPVVLETVGCRTTQDRNVGVASPHFRLRNTPGPLIATPGQMVRVPVFVDYRSGLTRTDGPITLSSPGAPAPVVFSPAIVPDHGGSFATIDTSSLSAGIHTFGLQGNSPGPLLPRYSSISIDVRTVSSITVTHQLGGTPTALSGYNFTSSGAVFIIPTILDQNSNDITYSIDQPAWTSSNPSVVDIFVDPSPFGGVQLLIKGNGSATITATMPNGSHWDFPVTVDVPATPAVLSHAFFYPAIDNSGTPENSHYFLTNALITYYSWSVATLGVSFGNSSFGDGGMSHTGNFTVNEGQNPGQYLFTSRADTTVGTVRSAIKLTVNNAAGKGLIAGQVSSGSASAVSGGPMMSDVTGDLEFYDSSTGTLAFSRSIWSMSSSFTAPYLAPGSYKVRFASTGPSSNGLAQWYPNSQSFADAQTVVVSAGGNLAGIDFFLNPVEATPPIPTFATPPARDTANQTFSLGVQTENGAVYLLQKSFTLTEDSWFTILTVYGDGTAQALADAEAVEPYAFYRIVRR